SSAALASLPSIPGMEAISCCAAAAVLDGELGEEDVFCWAQSVPSANTPTSAANCMPRFIHRFMGFLQRMANWLILRRLRLVAASSFPGPPKCSSGSLFQRGHVDDEAILHVASQQPFVGGVDLVDSNHFDVRTEAVLAAEVQHRLRLSDSADDRTGQGPPA